MHALQGDKDAAFAALDQAVAAGFHGADYLDKDTDLESLRADARFAALRDAVRAKEASMPASEKEKKMRCDHSSHHASASAH